MPKYAHVEKRPDGVALVRLDYPNEKINKLSSAMIGEFETILRDLNDDAAVKAVVLVSDKPDCFIAGADIDELRALQRPADALSFIQNGQRVINQIAASRKPVIAAIHGACLGGGLEVAMACHYRLATDHPKTQLGLPEVKLGLLPAAGGTQRLPRLVGLTAGLDLLLTGKTVYARKARKLGLVDDVVIPYDLTGQAVQAALRLAAETPKDRARKRDLRTQIMEDVGPARRYVFQQARGMVMKQTKGNYPAPLAILECVEHGWTHGLEAGMAREAEQFSRLALGPEAASLISLFFAMNDKKRQPLAKGARRAECVGVLGAGLMGAGVGLVTVANTEARVLMKDISPEAVAAGEKYVFAEFDRRHRKGALKRIERDRLLSRVAAQTTYEGFDQADLIVEAVFEDLDLKRRVLAEAEAVMREDCVFASNTSALPIADIAKGCRRPANVLGMHYFSPVPAMPLLEIIVAPKTSEAALKTAVALGAAQGKTVIVVKDGPGFYTTRILAAYLNETGLLLEEGASIEQLDRAMTTFGFPVGPVTLIDEVGLDVAAHVGKFLGGWFNEARGIKASDGVQRMFAAGYKGRKNKKGFYVYERPAQPKWQKYVPWTPKRKKEPDPAAYQFFGGERRALDDGLIQRRHAFVMVNEALLCLQEGVLSSPTDGDLGAILGLGFPPFRGGPFRYVDAFGAAKLAANMEALAGTYGPQFKPCALLLDTAKTGQKFYP